jgi:hypothetical protein
MTLCQPEPLCASLPGPQSVTRITLEAIENDSGNGKIKTVTGGGVEHRKAKPASAFCGHMTDPQSKAWL